MKPEPLIGKVLDIECGGVEEGFDYEDVKSACEFYLKYKDSPKLLMRDFPEYKKKVDYFLEGMVITPTAIVKYNEWLFKLAFKDVLKGDKR